jgi:hypothetical protein
MLDALLVKRDQALGIQAGGLKVFSSPWLET